MIDVVDEHREVVERRSEQVEQPVHEDVDAHGPQRIPHRLEREHDALGSVTVCDGNVTVM